jgi:hypothetical protein
VGFILIGHALIGSTSSDHILIKLTPWALPYTKICLKKYEGYYGYYEWEGEYV